MNQLVELPLVESNLDLPTFDTLFVFHYYWMLMAAILFLQDFSELEKSVKMTKMAYLMSQDFVTLALMQVIADFVTMAEVLFPDFLSSDSVMAASLYSG